MNDFLPRVTATQLRRNPGRFVKQVCDHGTTFAVTYKGEVIGYLQPPTRRRGLGDTPGTAKGQAKE
jgi:hypothetical protein